MKIGDWHAEGGEDECGAEEDAEADKEPNHGFYLLLRNRTGLQSVRFATVLVGIRAFESVTEFVAEIAEDLQAEGGEDGQDER